MTLLKPIVALASAAWLVVANAGLEAPRIGFVRLTDRQVWTLRGVAGSFYFGERMASQIDQIAFNGQTGVRTSANRTAELLGPSGEVLRTVRIEGEVRRIGLSPLESAAYVLTENELWRLTPSAVNRYSAPALPEGHLAGISGAGSYVEFGVVQDEGQASLHRLQLDSDEAETRESFAARPDLLLVLRQGALLWSEGDTLVLRRRDASLTKVDTGSRIVALHEAGPDWFQATGEDGRQFVIRLGQGGTELVVNLLPETAE